MERTSIGSRRSATSSTGGDAMARLMLPLGLYPGPLARRTEHTLLRLLNAALRRHVRASLPVLKQRLATEGYGAMDERRAVKALLRR